MVRHEAGHARMVQAEEAEVGAQEGQGQVVLDPLRRQAAAAGLCRTASGLRPSFRLAMAMPFAMSADRPSAVVASSRLPWT